MRNPKTRKQDGFKEKTQNKKASTTFPKATLPEQLSMIPVFYRSFHF